MVGMTHAKTSLVNVRILVDWFHEQAELACETPRKLNDEEPLSYLLKGFKANAGCLKCEMFGDEVLKDSTDDGQ